MGRSIDERKGGDFRTREQPAWLSPREAGFALALHVQPGARRTAVVGPHGERLKIAVACPPVDGRANEALVEYLATRLGVSRSQVSVLAGANSREKRVAVETGLSAAAVAAALAPVDRK